MTTPTCAFLADVAAISLHPDLTPAERFAGRITAAVRLAAAEGVPTADRTRIAVETAASPTT